MSPEFSKSLSVFAPKGPLTVANRDSFTTSIREALGRGQRTLVLDCAEVPLIDAGALGSLVAIRKEILAAGGSLWLENVNDTLYDLFYLTKLNAVFAINQRAA